MKKIKEIVEKCQGHCAKCPKQIKKECIGFRQLLTNGEIKE